MASCRAARTCALSRSRYPDGGLVLIAEDRTEQLALSAVRDNLLRTPAPRRSTACSRRWRSSRPTGRYSCWKPQFCGHLGAYARNCSTRTPAPNELPRGESGAISCGLTRPN